MQIKKYLSLWFLPLMALAMAATGCGNAKVNELKREVDNFNRQCPVDLGFIGQLDSVSYDDADRNLVIHATLKEDFVDESDFTSSFGDLNKSNMQLMIGTPENEKMTKLLADIGAGIRMEYTCPGEAKDMVISLSADEVKELVEHPMTETERNDLLMQNTISQTNALCPQEIEDGLTLVKAEDDGENIIYHYSVDENQYSMAQLEENLDEIRMSVEFSLRGDPAMSVFAGMIGKAGRNLVYRYTGDTFGNSFDVTLSPSTLKSFPRPTGF